MQDWLGTTSELGRPTNITDYAGNQVGYSWNRLGQKELLIYPDGSTKLRILR